MIDQFKFNCPACQTSLDLEFYQVSKISEIRCPSCRRKYVAQKEVSPLLPNNPLMSRSFAREIYIFSTYLGEKDELVAILSGKEIKYINNPRNSVIGEIVKENLLALFFGEMSFVILYGMAIDLIDGFNQEILLKQPIDRKFIVFGLVVGLILIAVFVLIGAILTLRMKLSRQKLQT